MMKNRAGFSMITAIGVLIVMSTISVLVLQMSMRNSRVTIDSYRDRQAALWAQSYMNYAKLAIMKNRELIVENNRTHAIESIHGNQGTSKTNGGYTITVQISYMGVKRPFNCSKSRVLDVSNHNPSAIIDVYVKYSVLDNTWRNLMTYHIREVVGI